MSDTPKLPPLPTHHLPIGLVGAAPHFQDAARKYAEEYLSVAWQAWHSTGCLTELAAAQARIAELEARPYEGPGSPVASWRNLLKELDNRFPDSAEDMLRSDDACERRYLERIDTLRSKLAELEAQSADVDERKEFEEWAAPYGFTDFGRIGGTGMYVDPECQSAWRSWEASAALRPAPKSKESWDAATNDLLAERERQKRVEGWSSEHDDEHTDEALAFAASCYATADEGDAPPAVWPWSAKWWKPKDRRSNLIRAGALILAEIERLDRAALRPAPKSEDATVSRKTLLDCADDLEEAARELITCGAVARGIKKTILITRAAELRRLAAQSAQPEQEGK